MISLATYNIKGGVGKTAAAVNLAYEASRTGLRTLLWDLDPQGAASFYLRVDPSIDGGAARLLDKKKALRKSIRTTSYANLSMLPADFSYRHLDIDLYDRKNPEYRLTKRLASVEEDFDLLIIDCAPNMSLVSESVFHAVDWLLVPVIPTPLSVRAYTQIRQYLHTQQNITARLLPFFSMVDRRKNIHRATVAQFAAEHEEVIRSYIPYASDIERMGEQRAPVNAFAAGTDAGRAFLALWHAVQRRLQDALPIPPAI
ncbi:MAG: AAA family ATPase [Gammaproteobacteria bacterium]|nr:AAA family ATPase [Gammaproteobacteria bacterium]